MRSGPVPMDSASGARSVFHYPPGLPGAQQNSPGKIRSPGKIGSPGTIKETDSAFPQP